MARNASLPRLLRASLLVGLFGPGVAFAQSAGVPLTNSQQLNLARELAAVNFYFSTGQGQQQVTSSIQGEKIDNLDLVTRNNTAFQLTDFAGPDGGTLTASLPNAISPNPPFNGDGRELNMSSSITGTGADEAPTEQFATAFDYFAPGQTGSLSFAFGNAHASEQVQVQILGNDENWSGTMEVRVRGALAGTYTSNGSQEVASLLTFPATTDTAGNLVLDLTATGQYAGIAGVIVTGVPEPGALGMATMGLFGLLGARRRRNA